MILSIELPHPDNNVILVIELPHPDNIVILIVDLLHTDHFVIQTYTNRLHKSNTLIT